MTITQHEARTVLWGRKLPGCAIEKKLLIVEGFGTIFIKLNTFSF